MEEELEKIPMIAYENEKNRHYKQLRLIIISFIVLFITLCATFCFIWYNSGTMVETYDVSTENGGNANYNSGS